MDLPEVFKENMRLLLGDEFESYLASFNHPRYYGMRINRLKTDVQEVQALSGLQLDPVSWCADGFYYSGDFRPAKSPLYHAGLYYIQEPSAMSPAAVLPIEAGDRVLDICSAPGGKSTHIASKLQNTGVLVCNDISGARCKALLKNMEMAGATNYCITNETPERLAGRFEGFFNKILIDAPCSGEGMFRKDENAVKAWEAHKDERCAQMQRQILYYAAGMLAPGGMIIYSTCTFNMLENELQIKDFLEKNRDIDLVDIDHGAYGFAKGMAVELPSGKSMTGAARLWPHIQRGEGHFLALMQKTGQKSERPHPVQVMGNSGNISKINGIQYFDTFMAEHIKDVSLENKNLTAHNTSIMAVPEGLPDLKGLRLVRSGWYLGDIKTKRFEPSQAFAMGLQKRQVYKTVTFSMGEENLIRYLKGESFDVAAADGWHLVCLGEFPLGWGKVKDGRLKNKYLKSWMMD